MKITIGKARANNIGFDLDILIVTRSLIQAVRSRAIPDLIEGSRNAGD